MLLLCCLPCWSFLTLSFPLFHPSLSGSVLANVDCVLLRRLSLPRLSALVPLRPVVRPGGPEQYLLLQTPLMFTEQMQQDVIMVLKFPSNSPVTHVAANTQTGLTSPAIITVTANRLFAVNKWHGLTGEAFLKVHCKHRTLSPFIFLSSS